MNTTRVAICRTCLVEGAPLISLFSNYEPVAGDGNGEEEDESSRVQLSTIYSELTRLPLRVEPIPAEICFPCAERLKEIDRFRRKAVAAYEELETKANIAQIISQLDQSSLGSVRNNRLEEDFAEELIAEDELSSRPKVPLAAGEQRCDVCQKVFKNKMMLFRHQEIHASENKYKCRYCGRWYRARSSWYNHELKHRRAVGRKKKLEQEFLCEICAKRFKAKNALRYHLEIVHEGVKRFRCDICSKSFTRNGSLAEHKLIQHAGIKQFSCKICCKAFGKEDSLKTHETIHSGKRFGCELCTKTFLKKAFLNAHIAKVHPSDEAPKPVTCHVCQKTFTSTYHLKTHLLIHTDDRPEKCHLCGASFRQKQQLKVHMYQHTGKPFKCQFCAAAFGIRVRLKVHQEKNHPVELRNLTVQPSQQPPQIINEPDFGDGAINEEILNEICYQINANQIVLQNIEDDGVNLIYSSNEHIVFFDDGNNLLPDEIEGVDPIGQLYDFTKQGYSLPATEERSDLHENQ
ncbi:zinc finger protein 160-like [Topomyia yanbarensis]|uniref:zinc finger protein 160-like n=1 Tax=Topomyia yanbarensis TaxID=2498891 RepID=UPI00273C9745|nr:zinc finger protein 160-like [Topomyia yanbarensis]XP_058835592.1 zinc finger protein 160-like [Topomyia yanbarensis]